MRQDRWQRWLRWHGELAGWVRRTVLTAVAVLGLAAMAAAQQGAAGAADDGAESTGAVTARYAPIVSSATNSVRPNLRRGLPPSVAQRLQRAFAIAARRVSERAACSALFAASGADGVEKLRMSLYYLAAGSHAREVCGLGADALTSVGSAITWLCPSFSALSNDRAALVLIHEALHAAGLPEWPRDPGAMTSSQINTLVKESCAY